MKSGDFNAEMKNLFSSGATDVEQLAKSPVGMVKRSPGDEVTLKSVDFANEIKDLVDVVDPSMISSGNMVKRSPWEGSVSLSTKDISDEVKHLINEGLAKFHPAADIVKRSPSPDPSPMAPMMMGGMGGGGMAQMLPMMMPAILAGIDAGGKVGVAFLDYLKETDIAKLKAQAGIMRTV